MAPTIELIESITLSSDTANVTFSSIPQDYDDLYITCFSRTTRSSSNDGVIARFNGAASDTNHSSRSIVGDGSSTYSFSQAYVRVGYATAATTLANTFGSSEMYITGYSGSNVKSMSSFGAQENNTTASDMGATAGLWNSTDPISSIEIRPLTGPNFTASSTFELYGIKDADDGAEGRFGPAAQGGDEVYTTGDGYKVHVFKSSGTLTVTNPWEVEYLVVAGGGGGASCNAGVGDYQGDGGGGAGGYRASSGNNSGGGCLLESPKYINSGTYAITIGAGGPGQTVDDTPSNSGSNSIFYNIVSIGGGGGGVSTTAGVAKNGGSGGGQDRQNYGPAGVGISCQGFNGGNSNNGGAVARAGGGGGGAGSIGGSAPTIYIGGSGGAGIEYPPGSSKYYAGGGGGGGQSGGAGGSAVGGNGGNSTGNGGSGVVNTGSGGGGGAVRSYNSSDGGNGGSGIVIIRYKIW
jgi:hypothetical protein